MHGMIFGNHYDYMHARVGPDPADPDTAFTIPARTCVWGASWQRSLTDEGHYPAAAVAVTGNWRYDSLPRLRERRRELRGRLGVHGDEPLIAILTSVLETPAFVAACLDAIALVPGAVPRVRLHPIDEAAPVARTIADHALPPEVLTSRGALAELVLSSDVVIAQYSTAVAESVMLDRPTILVDLLGRGGWEAYADAGVCDMVRVAGDLPAALARALGDERARSAMAAARERYVADNFLALDGRSGARVASVVAELVRGA
jgi:hypothetical protein